MVGGMRRAPADVGTVFVDHIAASDQAPLVAATHLTVAHDAGANQSADRRRRRAKGGQRCAIGAVRRVFERAREAAAIHYCR